MAKNSEKPTIKIPKGNLTYDDWLEFFRKRSAGENEREVDELKDILPHDGYAALKRWLEISENPSKMDKLYQGRLKQQTEADIMDVAVGDDDEAFWMALIKENVSQLNSSRTSPQEVARLTTNIGIFRDKLHEIRARKPKKGTVLEQVLEKAAKPPKKATTAKKQGSKTASKGSEKKKTVSKSARSKNA